MTAKRIVLLVRMMPKVPNCHVKSLSSSEDMPKYELSYTALRQRAHRWMAVLVRLTRKGMRTIAIMPNINIAIIVNKYPNMLGS